MNNLKMILANLEQLIEKELRVERIEWYKKNGRSKVKLKKDMTKNVKNTGNIYNPPKNFFEAAIKENL